MNKFSFLKAHIIFLFYKVANILLDFLVIILWPRPLLKNPKKICIYRIGNIGDIICTIPALIAVRRAYPKAEITLLTSPGKKGMYGAMELIKGAWFIDKIEVYYSEDIKNNAGRWRLIKEIRSQKFDLWIMFPNEMWNIKVILRNMLFAKLCGVKKAFGFVLSTIKIWTKEQSKYREFDNEVERLIKILKKNIKFISDKIEYDLPLTREIKEASENIIKDHNLQGKNLFGFVMSGKRTANEWPVANFIELGRAIININSEARFIIFGSKGDYEKAQDIVRGMGTEAVNLCGKTSLLEAVAIINKLDAMISVNTGLMHIASQAGVFTVGIFSSAELYGKWFPLGVRVKVLFPKNIECAGCYYKDCKNNYRCISSIKPEEVFAALKEIF